MLAGLYHAGSLSRYVLTVKQLALGVDDMSRFANAVTQNVANVANVANVGADLRVCPVTRERNRANA